MTQTFISINIYVMYTLMFHAMFE